MGHYQNKHIAYNKSVALLIGRALIEVSSRHHIARNSLACRRGPISSMVFYRRYLGTDFLNFEASE